MPSVSAARRARRTGLALAGVLALAACTAAPAPTTTPTTIPAPTAATSPADAPTPAPTAEPAASATGTIGAVVPSPAVDRLAAGIRGSRVCVENGAGASMDVTATSNEVVDPGAPGSATVVESASIPSGGSWCTHGYNDCTRANTDYVVDVCGFITLPDGRSVAYWAYNPYAGEPYLAFHDGAGAQVEHRWSVGQRDAITTGGYTVTSARMEDAPSDKLYTLTVTPAS